MGFGLGKQSYVCIVRVLLFIIIINSVDCYVTSHAPTLQYPRAPPKLCSCL